MGQLDIIEEDTFSIPTNQFDLYLVTGVTIEGSFLEESLTEERISVALKHERGFLLLSEAMYNYTDIVDNLEYYDSPDEDDSDEPERPSCSVCGYETFKMKQITKYPYSFSLDRDKQRLNNAIDPTGMSNIVRKRDIPICIHCVEDINENISEYMETVPENLLAKTI